MEHFNRTLSEISQQRLNLQPLTREHYQSCDGMDELQPPVCPICLDSIALDSLIYKTPCTHIYHKDCLDTWLTAHTVCPYCRFNFEEEHPLYRQ
ncbi:hypothetical protein FGO68_gene1903 [Halteria grandinella]|uniref:RING-type domain-containing protein n=1 Tax=Halteria grandinella TaxID=5974 RepID=A0A8J8NPL9_HALGN|nr:hypothetical protein FGO68_gene1903 [Halteria grandinella]